MPTSSSKKMSGVLYDKPGKIEHYEKRFGLIAIEKGYISAEDVVKAFTIQVSEDVDHQSHRLMGEILFDLGIMADKEIEDVVSEIFSAKK